MGEPFGVLARRAGHGSLTTSGSNTGCPGRLPPLTRRVEPGLRASRRDPHTVPLQIASFADAATRPRRENFAGVSSLWVNCKVAARRPRLTHCATNARSMAAGEVHAIRLSTVLA